MAWHREENGVYSQGDYVCVSVNMGKLVIGGEIDAHGHHWWYEVEYRGKFVGRSATLADAKRLADKHRRADASTGAT